MYINNNINNKHYLQQTLKAKLKEIFQFDNEDLDFGMRY